MACFRYEGLMDGASLLKAHIQVEDGYKVPRSVIHDTFSRVEKAGEEGTIRIFFEASGKSWIFRR